MRPPRVQNHWCALGRYARKSHSANNSSLCVGKNAPFSTERPRFVQRSPYFLDLGGIATRPAVARKTKKTSKNGISGRLQNHSYAEFKSKRSDKESRTGTIQPKLARVQASSGYHIIGHNATFGNISSNSKSRGKPTLRVLTESVEWYKDIAMQVICSCEKRHRVEPFTQMVSKARPHALPKMATSTFLSVTQLWTYTVEESAHYFRKRHIRSRRLHHTCGQVSLVLHQYIQKHPSYTGSSVYINGVLLECMESNNEALDEVVE